MRWLLVVTLLTVAIAGNHLRGSSGPMDFFTGSPQADCGRF